MVHMTALLVAWISVSNLLVLSSESPYRAVHAYLFLTAEIPLVDLQPIAIE